MIFSLESIKPQLEELKIHYPDLEIVESDEKHIRFHGSILVHRTVCDFSLFKTYDIDIVVPINSNELPYAIDTGHQISDTYRHFYPKTRGLCLETDTMIRVRFIDGFNLLEWMDEFVEPYFIYYEFYQIYGTFPAGERSHGCEGIITISLSMCKSVAKKDLCYNYIG